jgi:hypothetical protein
MNDGHWQGWCRALAAAEAGRVKNNDKDVPNTEAARRWKSVIIQELVPSVLSSQSCLMSWSWRDFTLKNTKSDD